MNDETNGNPKQQVIGSIEALSESSLAVDLARVDIEQAIATAHRFPRRIAVVQEQIKAVVLCDEAAAKASVYALPRAGKPIVGPSVNFADALAGAWGNCHDGARFVAINRTDKIVVCDGIFFDLQTNRRTLATATRRISNARGQIYNDDMIAVTIGACNSIARRNAILRGVPRPIWHQFYEMALITVRGTEATLPERRDDLIKSFAAFGVEPMRVANALGVTKKEEITLDHIVVLQGMFEQLRAGDITAEEMFDPRRMTGVGFETDENPLGDGGTSGGAARQSTPAAASSGGPTQERSSLDGTQGGPGIDRTPRAAAEVADASSSKADRSSGEGAKDAQAKPGPKRQPTAADIEQNAPRTPEEYLKHGTRWLIEAKSVEEINTRWSAERTLRNAVGLTSEEREPLETLKKERLAALSGR